MTLLNVKPPERRPDGAGAPPRRRDHLGRCPRVVRAEYPRRLGRARRAHGPRNRRVTRRRAVRPQTPRIARPCRWRCCWPGCCARRACPMSLMAASPGSASTGADQARVLDLRSRFSTVWRRRTACGAARRVALRSNVSTAMLFPSCRDASGYRRRRACAGNAARALGLHRAGAGGRAGEPIEVGGPRGLAGRHRSGVTRGRSSGSRRPPRSHPTRANQVRGAITGAGPGAASSGSSPSSIPQTTARTTAGRCRGPRACASGDW